MGDAEGNFKMGSLMVFGHLLDSYKEPGTSLDTFQAASATQDNVVTCGRVGLINIHSTGDSAALLCW